MKRCVGLAGSVVAAVLVLSAAMAATALAQEIHSDAETGKTTTLSGEQVTMNKFTVNGGTISCKKVTFAGSMVGAKAEELAVNPTFSECTAFGRAATAKSTEIYYTYTWTIPLLWYHMRVSIGPSPIAFTVPSLPCTVTLGEQTINHSKMENKEKEGVKSILVTNEFTGVEYTESGAGCLGTGVGTPQTNGTFTGSEEIKGKNESGKATSVWVE